MYYFTCLLQINNLTLQKRIQLLSPDLRKLADDMLQNKLFYMGQFHVSKETNLNTVLIAGLLCHVAVLLLYAEDNGFLKPLTLIHYDPSALRGKYLPTIACSTPSASVLRPEAAKKYSQSMQPMIAKVIL